MNPKRTLVVVGALLMACGDGVHSASNLGQPIAVLHGSIEGQPLVAVPNEDLRASVIWAALSSDVEDCMAEAQGIHEIANCTGSSLFTPALASNSVAIQPVFPAQFEVPLHSLPHPAALTGRAGAWFGFGILAVYQDGNHNQELDLIGPEATHSADTVLAASGGTTRDDMDLVVYREGELSPMWKLFFGCDNPGQGFSVVRMTFTDEGPPSCTVASPNDTVIGVFFETSDEVRELVCQATPDVDGAYPDTPPSGNSIVECESDTSMRVQSNPLAYCANWKNYSLVGCADFACTTLDWDLTASPPSWWPCGQPSANTFSLVDNVGTPTSAADPLLSIHYDAGNVTYPVNQMEIWIFVSPTEAHAFTLPWLVTHADNDGDHQFSPGDVLSAAELSGFDWFNESAVGASFEVLLIQRVQGSPAQELADFVWTP